MDNHEEEVYSGDDGLRPCPFCGSPLEEMHILRYHGDLYIVECSGCDATGPDYSKPMAGMYQTREMAIKGWNTRR